MPEPLFYIVSVLGRSQPKCQIVKKKRERERKKRKIFMTFEIIFGVGRSTASCPGVTLCHFRVSVPAGVTMLVQPSTTDTVNVFFACLYKVTQESASCHFHKKQNKSKIKYKWLLQDTDTTHIPESVQCTVNGRDRILLSFCCSLLLFY